jgi:7-cyano-7-deazaguanine synthase
MSGGMDSIALAWELRPDLCITVDYGQRAAEGEIRASAAVCETLNLKHRILKIDCSSLGSGDMSESPALSMAPASEWWPFRNQLLITFAAAVAIQEDISRIAIGTVANDGTHADGRADFVKAMAFLLSQQEGRIALEAPGIGKTTVELCNRAQVPFRILAWSHSCHVAPIACGRCRGCYKHRECMRALGHGDY